MCQRSVAQSACVDGGNAKHMLVRSRLPLENGQAGEEGREKRATSPISNSNNAGGPTRQ